MKELKAHIKVKQKLFIALLFLFIAFICFSNKTNAQGWSFTFQEYAHGNCYGIHPPTFTLPNLGIPTKSQCESIRQQILAIKGTSGGCTVGFTCTPCTGSDIIIPGQESASPGNVSFDGQFEGRPLFTPHQSQAFEDWATGYKQQLESYGITSILGKNITPHQVPLTDNMNFNNFYYSQSANFNPATPPENLYAEDASVVDLRGKEGIVQLLTTTEEQVNRDKWVNETVEELQSDLNQNYPDFTQTEVNEIIDYVEDIISKGLQVYNQTEVNDIIYDIVDIIRYLRSTQVYSQTPIDNSNSELFTINKSQTTTNGYHPGNPPTNLSSEKLEQKEPPMTKLDATGMALTVVDLGLTKYKDNLQKVGPGGTYSKPGTISDIMKIKELSKISGVVGSALGGWSFGGDLNDIYNDIRTNQGWAKTTYDISNAVGDAGLLIAGIAGAAAVGTVVFGFSVTAVGASPLVLFGSAVFFAASKYYVKDNKTFDKK